MSAEGSGTCAGDAERVGCMGMERPEVAGRASAEDMRDEQRVKAIRIGGWKKVAAA